MSLGAGVVTLGVAAALMGGAAVAVAETGTDSASSSSSESSSSSPASTGGTASTSSTDGPSSADPAPSAAEPADTPAKADGSDPGTTSSTSSASTGTVPKGTVSAMTVKISAPEAPKKSAPPKEAAAETPSAPTESTPAVIVDTPITQPVEAAPTTPAPKSDTPPARSNSASRVTTTTSAAAVTLAASQRVVAPAPVTLQTLLAGFVAQMQYIFFNQAPTITVPKIATGQGFVSGTLSATSGNGQPLIYKVVKQPKYGTVSLDAATGAYTYTPMDVLVTPGITDSFTVSVDNGAALRLTGLAGVVQQSLHSVAKALHMAGSDTAVTGVNITATGTGKYGDPGNAAYWQQQSYGDCQMMATAAVIGQLTQGTPPTEQSILTEASQTKSVVHRGYIWDFSDPDSGTNSEDAVVLLKNHGIIAELSSFDGNKATFANGLLQFEKLKVALAQGKAVMTSVNANTLWAASAFGGDGSSFTDPNHSIVVIAVDATNGKVMVNDSGLPDGRAMEVPLGAFLWGWQSTGFDLIVAQLAEPAVTADTASSYALAA
ncbi:hypothetical protein D8S82_30800 [Mycobacterium hodleri]|uniref:Peptidase C39-like domain-containing protein n=1 Tax=Mycolicibacterium hodleri TaxID=49897 RepID=A0A544VRR3_9MYCO|nr:hypothetical protein D8S82_30800 [Mycolicibacterium hodleri]